MADEPLQEIRRNASVTVYANDVCSARAVQGRVEAVRNPPVAVVHEANARVAAGDLANDVARSVGRASIRDYDLERRVELLRQDGLQRRADLGGLVPDRHDHRDLGRSRARPFGRVAQCVGHAALSASVCSRAGPCSLPAAAPRALPASRAVPAVSSRQSENINNPHSWWL